MFYILLKNAIVFLLAKTTKRKNNKARNNFDISLFSTFFLLNY